VHRLATVFNTKHRNVGNETGSCAELAGNLETISSEETIHSFVQLDSFPYSTNKKDKKNLRIRVKRIYGFAGPNEGLPKLQAVPQDDPDADVIVIDDAGNGFRDVESVWPKALVTEGKHPIVLSKMNRPLTSGELWKTVYAKHAERLVVVINADDLRAEGVNISRQLSWERTAKDFAWQLACNSKLSALANCRHLIVQFGIDGAIYTRRDGEDTESVLYYDPTVTENGFENNCPGQMLGCDSAFTAALVAKIVAHGFTAIGEGVLDGILSSRRLYRAGFGKQTTQLDYPYAEIFGSQTVDDAPLAKVVVPNPTAPEPADPNFWCILKERTDTCLEEMAYDIVVNGDVQAMQGVPVGKFGFLKTVDRTEIESYRSVKNLIIEYLATSSTKRPLSIAVFGPPGSGKSFGVTQVAESVAPGRIETIEFNVSQFQSPNDLVEALHKVRDIVLGGSVPLVFFDEFDSALTGKLSWLKYFLAPMQDGEFRDGDTLHPIGRAIFIFAGGTSENYESFCYGREDNPERQKQPEEFRSAKGPDFVSRLRGYINVLGINTGSDDDQLYMIRRAIVLRSMLERFAKQLIEKKTGRARIDPDVLRALIKVPKYKHGTRSMEAILDMSMLAGRNSFEQASLPPGEQLKLHVDAEMFSRLVVRDVLFGSARELLGESIHEQYREEQNGIKADDSPMPPWAELDENLKESNRQQADQIPGKLRTIGCGYAPVIDRSPTPVTFTTAEVEMLAELEHERWVAERRLAGWVHGPNRDRKKKVSPHLIDWNDLSDEIKQKDRNSVINIPNILARANFEIYRLRPYRS